MTLKDRAIVHVGVVNQSLSAVVQGFEAIEIADTEASTTSNEKLGIRTQLYARIDFHMEAARKALTALEATVASQR